MEILRKIVSRTALIVTLGVALLLVGSAYSCYVTPNRTVLAAYLGLAFPIILAINVGMLFWWAILKRKYLFITLAAMLLSGGSIWRYTPLNLLPPQAAVGDTLKVLTYNTHVMAGCKPHMKQNPNEVLLHLKNCDADIICLQEFGFINHQKYLELKTINKALEEYPYRDIFLIREAFTSTGMAIYSKYPIKKADNFKHRNSYNGTCIYEIDVDGRLLTIVSNHLESNALTVEERELYKDIIKDPDTDKLRKAGKTLAPKMGNAFKARAIQADRLAEKLRHIKTPLIVCGDFNDTPQSYVYRRVRGDMRDAVVEVGLGPTITYNSKGFWFRIDHIVHSSHLHVVDVEKGDSKASDHYPLQTTFVW